MDKNGNPTETVVEAVVRGIREECGKPDFLPLAIYGAEMKRVNPEFSGTRKGDSIFSVQPFDFVQQMGPPQPWIGPVFLVGVSTGFEPDHSKSDGEASEPKWWEPRDLITAIEKEPHKFMGLHMPSLQKAALLFAEGVFSF